MEASQAKAPPEVRNVINFLRTKAGMKTKVGVLNGKRQDYFKGKLAVKALTSPAYAKLQNVPQFKTVEEAQNYMSSIMPYTFFLLVDRGGRSGGSKSPKVLQITPVQKFSTDGYYAWFYEGSQWLTYVGGLVLVACMLAAVMFPLWPPFMRLGVWYLSMLVLAFLAALFALAIVRLIIYIITVFTIPPGLWIFPQLFADVGFFESFVPLYEWDYPKKKGKKGKGKEKEVKGKEKEGSSGEKKSKKSKGEGASVKSASGSAPPTQASSRSATVEEIEDD